MKTNNLPIVTYKPGSYEAYLEKCERDAKEAIERPLLTKPARALGVFQKTSRTTILQARCQYHYDEKLHYLIFENQWLFKIEATHHIKIFIEENIPEPVFNRGFFVNTKRLASALGDEKSYVNCERMLPSDSQEISELYEELSLGNRILNVEEVNLNFDDIQVRGCINQLIYAFSRRLSGKLLAGFVPYGTYLDISEQQMLAYKNDTNRIGIVKSY